MGLADRVVRKFLAATKLATISDADTLKQLVQMEAESMADELPRDEYKEVMRRVRVTPAVKEHARAWDAAVEHVLLDWCRKNMDSVAVNGPDLLGPVSGPLRDHGTVEGVVKVMMELGGGAGYLYFMEHEGHGVGTWDGDWDVLFKTPRPTIKTLSQHVLAATRQAYQGLKDALFDAALEAMPTEEFSLNASRTAATLDLDLAKVFADAWPAATQIKFGAKVVPPELLANVITSNWLDGERVAYDLRNLHFRSSTWMSPVEWTQQMKVCCPSYNSFSANKVGRWLAAFGGIEVQAARELSPCLYVKGDESTLKSMVAMAKKMAGADEADIDGGVLRLWWD
jgi:hypothetical protein